MANFFEIQVGDKIKINNKFHIVRGKSLGRDWRAIRTNFGLYHIKNNQEITAIPYLSKISEVAKKFFI